MRVILIAYGKAVQKHLSLREFLLSEGNHTVDKGESIYELTVISSNTPSYKLCLPRESPLSPLLILVYHFREDQIRELLIENEQLSYNSLQDATLQVDLTGNWKCISHNPCILVASARANGVSKVLQIFEEGNLEELQKLRDRLVSSCTGST